jgi:AraC-like DNA-binding protein
MKLTPILHLSELLSYHKFNDRYDDKLAIVTLDASTPGLGSIKPTCVNMYSIILIQDGSVNYSVNGKHIAVSRDEMLLLSPEHLAGIVSFSPDFKGLHLMVERRYYEHIVSLDGMTVFATTAHYPKLAITPELYEDLAIIMLQIKTILHRNYRNLDQIIARLVKMTQLFTEEALQNNQATQVASTHKELLFRKFVGLAVSNFKEEHRIEFYASKLCITTTYLSRIVREISSNTVNGFISELLFNECCHYLRTTDMPISEIAEALNFATQSSLGKFFKKYSGLSPYAYRAAQNRDRRAIALSEEA